MIVGTATAVIAVALAVVLPIAGPVIEARLAPVLIDGRIIHQQRAGDQVAFAVEGNRRRPACMYLDVIAQVEQPGHPQRIADVETPFSGRNVSRPPGLQSMGVWRVPKPPNPDGVDMAAGTVVTFFVRYQCHVLWDTMAVIGPVRVE